MEQKSREVKNGKEIEKCTGHHKTNLDAGRQEVGTKIRMAKGERIQYKKALRKNNWKEISEIIVARREDWGKDQKRDQKRGGKR